MSFCCVGDSLSFSPDYSDNNVRQAMLQQGMNSMGNMFGATATPSASIPFATEANFIRSGLAKEKTSA